MDDRIENGRLHINVNAPFIVVSLRSALAARNNEIKEVVLHNGLQTITINSETFSEVVFPTDELKLNVKKHLFPFYPKEFLILPPQIDMAYDVQLDVLNDMLNELKRRTNLEIELGFKLPLEQFQVSKISVDLPLYITETPELPLYQDCLQIITIDSWTEYLDSANPAVVVKKPLVQVDLLSERIYYCDARGDLYRCHVAADVVNKLTEFNTSFDVKSFFTSLGCYAFYRVDPSPYPEFRYHRTFICDAFSFLQHPIQAHPRMHVDQKDESVEVNGGEEDLNVAVDSAERNGTDLPSQTNVWAEATGDEPLMIDVARLQNCASVETVFSYFRQWVVPEHITFSVVRNTLLSLGYKHSGTACKLNLSNYARGLTSPLNPHIGKFFKQYWEQVFTVKYLPEQLYDSPVLDQIVKMILSQINWCYFYISTSDSTYINHITGKVLSQLNDLSIPVLLFGTFYDSVELNVYKTEKRTGNYFKEYLRLMVAWVVGKIRQLLIADFRAQNRRLEKYPNPLDCPQSMVLLSKEFEKSNSLLSRELQAFVSQPTDEYFDRLNRLVIQPSNSDHGLISERDHLLYCHKLIHQAIVDIYRQFYHPDLTEYQKSRLILRICRYFGDPQRVLPKVLLILREFPDAPRAVPPNVTLDCSYTQIPKASSNAQRGGLIDPKWSQWIYPKKVRKPNSISRSVYVGNPWIKYDLDSLNAGKILYHYTKTRELKNYMYFSMNKMEYLPNPLGGYSVYFLGEIRNTVELGARALPWMSTKNSLFDRRLVKITIEGSDADLKALETTYKRSFAYPLTLTNYYPDRVKTEVLIRMIEQHNARGTVIPQRSFAWGANLKYMIRTITLFGGNLFAERGPLPPTIIDRVDLEQTLIQMVPDAQKQVLSKALKIESKVAADLVDYHRTIEQSTTESNFYLHSALSKLVGVIAFQNYRKEKSSVVFINNVDLRKLDMYIYLKLLHTVKLIPKKAAKRVCALLFGELTRYFKRKPYADLPDRDEIKEKLRAHLVWIMNNGIYTTLNAPIVSCTLSQSIKDLLDSMDLDDWAESVGRIGKTIGNISRAELLRFYLNDYISIPAAKYVIIQAAKFQFNDCKCDLPFLKRVLEIQRDFERYLYDHARFADQFKQIKSTLTGIGKKLLTHRQDLSGLKPSLKFPDSIPSMPAHPSDLRARAAAVGAAWSLLHDYFGRFLAKKPDLVGTHLQRIAKEQSKRGYLIVKKGSDDFLFYSVYDPQSLKLYQYSTTREGARFEWSFNDYEKRIKLIIPTSEKDPFWRDSLPAQAALRELKFQIHRYCDRPVPQPVQAGIPIPQPPIQIIKKKDGKFGEFEEEQPPIPTPPQSGRHSPRNKLKQMYARIGRLIDFIETINARPTQPPMSMPFSVSHMKYYKKVVRRAARRIPEQKREPISEKSLTEIFKDRALCERLSGRLWPISGSQLRTKKILIDPPVNPTVLAADLLSCSSGLLDLSDASDQGSFINLQKWAAFCRLIQPRLQRMSQLNDAAAMYEELKEEFGSDDESAAETAAEEAEEAEEAEKGDDFSRLNVKLPPSKITVVESMLRKLLTIPASERAALVSDPDSIPDVFVPLISPIGARICNYITRRGKEISNRVDQIYLIRHTVTEHIEEEVVEYQPPKPEPVDPWFTSHPEGRTPKSDQFLYLAAVLSSEHTKINPDLALPGSTSVSGYFLIYPVSERVPDEYNTSTGSESVYTVLNRYFDACQLFCPDLEYIGYDRAAFTVPFGGIYGEFHRLAQLSALMDPLTGPDKNFLFLPASLFRTVAELQQDPNISAKAKQLLCKPKPVGPTEYETIQPGLDFSLLNGTIVKTKIMELGRDLVYRYRAERTEPVMERRFDFEPTDTLFSALCRLAESFRPITDYYSQGDPQSLGLTRCSLNGERLDTSLFNGRSDREIKKSVLGKRMHELRELLQSLSQFLVGATSKTDPSSIFNAPLVRINRKGQFFVDIPINFYSAVGYQSSARSDSYHVPWCVSTGIDLGQREFANYCTLSREEPPGASQVSVGDSVRQKVKRTRRVREQLSVKIKKYGGQAVKEVLHRWGSGQRQKRRTLAYTSKAAGAIVRNTLSELNKLPVYQWDVWERNKGLREFQRDFFDTIRSLLGNPNDVMPILRYMVACLLVERENDLYEGQKHKYSRLFNLMGRVVCENLKGFKGRGADLFSQRVSGSSSWSLTGQFRSRIKLLCERFGLGLSFVSPHYTSKIGYFADDNEPEAVAGYYASCKIVNGIPVLKLFDSPRVEVAAGSITSYLQSARSVVYEYRDGRFVGKDGAPFPGKKLSRALLRVFKVGRGFQPGDQYVEVSSGKWVRYKRTSDIYYLDRDYNSSINLAAYNEFGFTIKRLVVMRNRVSSGVREDESKRRLSSFGVHFLSLCKSLEKKNIRYLIDYAGVGANVKGFFQSSYKSLGIDSIPDSFK